MLWESETKVNRLPYGGNETTAARGRSVIKERTRKHGTWSAANHLRQSGGRSRRYGSGLAPALSDKRLLSAGAKAGIWILPTKPGWLPRRNSNFLRESRTSPANGRWLCNSRS